MQDSQPKLKSNESFPRESRLLNGKEFGRVFDKAQAFGAKGYTVLVRENQRSGARLGLVVGKKKLKRAVDRNLFKRLVRESFRRHRHQLPDLDIIVIAKPLPRHRINSITADLTRHWHKISKTCSNAQERERL